MPLTAEIEFLLGTFAAGTGHDRTPPEWPPAPARLYCALVSACHAEHDEALRWLEHQGAPTIHAAPATLSDPHPRWLVTNRLESSPKGSAAHPGRTNVERVRRRRSVRQQALIYTWPSAAPEPRILAALDDAARRVPYLGRAESPVAVRIHDGSVVPSGGLIEYTPATEGLTPHSLRIPYAGYFDALEAAFQTESRVEPPVYGDYVVSDNSDAPTDHATSASPWPHFLVLALRTDAWLPAQRTLELTTAFRTALLDRIEGDPSPVVLGHGAPAPHCAYLALPWAGHPHADGRVLGVGLAMPSGDTAGLRQIREALRDGTGDLAIELRNLKGFRSLRFAHSADRVDAVPWSARKVRWTHTHSVDGRGWVPARAWRTVLPAVLDVAPSRRISEREAVLRTIHNAGLPEPTTIEVRRGPFRHGDIALRSSHTIRRPADRFRPYRYLRFELEPPVAGPVVVGALRHFGLGLCVPEDDGASA